MRKIAIVILGLIASALIADVYINTNLPDVMWQ